MRASSPGAPGSSDRTSSTRCRGRAQRAACSTTCRTAGARTSTRRPSCVEGSLADPDAVAGAVAGTELVFHLGALGAVSRSVADPLTTDQVNVHGTLSVLTQACDAGVRRVVFASSSSVYGGAEVSRRPSRRRCGPARRTR